MATLDTSVSYALTNSFTGDAKLLGVSPSDAAVGPQMLAATKTDNTEGNNIPPENAQWFLTTTDLDPFYRLHTRAGGKALSLDVINTGGAAGSTALRLADTGRFSGQYWRFDLWSSDGSGYVYRLTNNFTGLDMHLDVSSDELVPRLAGGDYSGQHWKLDVVKAEGMASTSASASGGGSASETAGVVNNDPAGEGEPALSTGAIVGISVGGFAALGMLVLVIVFIAMDSARRKRSRTATGVDEADADMKAAAPVCHVSIGHGHRVDAPVELSTGSYPVPPVELASTQT